ncbi:MAG TPA: heparan-alpha-glucosaminide N-acetyltransferase domain-containing protein [Terriglobia bacterium]|nr:heparan-alpha-glucosaminide N-acetyltransferase domain-containing protein [Terriglobia bacterium]
MSTTLVASEPAVQVSNLETPGSGRLLSLDVFRGATIASMMLVNNAGNWNAVYPPLRHSAWHGWTFTDTIFPFFLWIAGVSMTFSFAKRLERNDSRARLLTHTVQRAATIFLLGLFLNLFPLFQFSTVRIPGVLQRIAVCYLIAGVIFLYTSLRGQILWTASLLFVYCALMKLAPVPGFGAGILEKEGNFAQYIDQLVLSGHMWASSKTWDPEGIVSTLPAIATVLFGILTGHLLRSRLNPESKTAWLMVMGNCLIGGGLVWAWWLPINKPLWTSSYSLFMAGMAANVFGCCYWLIDIKGYRRWSRPFAIYGMNAITVYVLAGALSKLSSFIKVAGVDGSEITAGKWVYEHIYAPLASPVNASLLYALTYVAILYGVSWFMHRMKWFVRV